MNKIVHVLNVKKSNGDLVPFDFQKLRVALIRSGANINELDRIIEEVFTYVYDGISTRKIYQRAYTILKKESKNAAGRYRLKKAIFDLGPSGYPFEKFMGRLYKHQGYDVKVGEIIKGQCVEHEVDVVAENEKEIIMVECKFHRQQGRKSDVKVTLYIKSRFDDIRSQLEKDGRLKNKTFQGVVATNTRFTDDARQYGICSGLKLLSWDFPSNNNLQTWVEDSNYHVITALSSANKKTKEILLENDIVLCREILEQKEKMLKIGIPESLIQKITKEAEAILK